MFQQSGLSTDQLAKVWAQVDRDGDGFINRQEFCQAMVYIRQIRGSSSVSTVLMRGWSMYCKHIHWFFPPSPDVSFY